MTTRPGWSTRGGRGPSSHRIRHRTLVLLVTFGVMGDAPVRTCLRLTASVGELGCEAGPDRRHQLPGPGHSGVTRSGPGMSSTPPRARAPHTDGRTPSRVKAVKRSTGQEGRPRAIGLSCSTFSWSDPDPYPRANQRSHSIGISIKTRDGVLRRKLPRLGRWPWPVVQGSTLLPRSISRSCRGCPLRLTLLNWPC